MSLFSHKIKYPIGIDIAGGSIKAVQLELNAKGGTRIKAYTHALLPKGVIVDDAVLDTKTLSYCLRTALDKPKFGQFSGSRVSASLPEAKSFVRVIHLPRMSDAEVDNAVPFEAESYVPVPMDQVYLDWQKLSEDSTGRMEILLIATPKDGADKLLAVFDKMRLNPQALEVESQSIQRALVKTGDSPTFLISDTDDHKTNLVMVENAKLSFTSSIPFGGNLFTEALSRSLGIAVEKAEKIKQEVGINNTPEYPNLKIALLPILKNLAAEIKNVLQFQTGYSQNPVKKIMLAGGGARLKNIQENLNSEFSDIGVTVEYANPLLNITEHNEKDLNLDAALDYCTSIGLALRIEY